MIPALFPGWPSILLAATASTLTVLMIFCPWPGERERLLDQLWDDETTETREGLNVGADNFLGAA